MNGNRSKDRRDTYQSTKKPTGVPKEIRVVFRSRDINRHGPATPLPEYKDDKESEGTTTTVEEIVGSDSFSSNGPSRGILKCKTVLDSLERDLLVPMSDSFTKIPPTSPSKRTTSKGVSFSFVIVHYHALVLADPQFEVCHGPPVALGRWKESKVFEDFEQYEEDRQYTPRPDEDLYMSPSLRTRLLMEESAKVNLDQAIEDIYRGLPFDEPPYDEPPMEYPDHCGYSVEDESRVEQNHQVEKSSSAISREKQEHGHYNHVIADESSSSNMDMNQAIEDIYRGIPESSQSKPDPPGSRSPKKKTKPPRKCRSRKVSAR